MKKLLFLLLLVPVASIAQIENDTKELKPMVDWDELYHQKYLGVGIMGLFKHPGAELNLSFPNKYYIKEKTKKGNEVRIQKARRWEAFARYYYHRNFHHNVMLTAGRTWQRSLKKDNFFISQADIGVARTFYTNPTFTVENGAVKRLYFSGDFYASFNYRLGLGKHWQHSNDTYRLYAYIGVMNFAPFNNFFYSRMVVGLNLNKFLKKEK